MATEAGLRESFDRLVEGASLDPERLTIGRRHDGGWAIFALHAGEWSNVTDLGDTKGAAETTLYALRAFRAGVLDRGYTMVAPTEGTGP